MQDLNAMKGAENIVDMENSDDRVRSWPASKDTLVCLQIFQLKTKTS